MALLTLGAGWSGAADLYVSQAGNARGRGTKASPLDIVTALSSVSPAKPGDTIYIAGTCEGPMKGVGREFVKAELSGTATKPIVIRPAPGQHGHINGAVQLTGSYLEIRDLDIGDLNWDPNNVKKTPAEAAFNARGGTGCHVLNCNIFGGKMGTGLWKESTNLIVYGCLVHDFGYRAEDRGHGHGFYTQNEEGTKTIEQNIAWRGTGWNLHIYGKAGPIQGYNVHDNIFYIAGCMQEGQTMDNFMIAGYLPIDRMSLVGNVGYQPSAIQSWRPNARLGNFDPHITPPALNGTAQVKNNYWMGAMFGFSMGNWKNIEVSGNTIWSHGILMEANTAPTGSGIASQPAKPNLAGYNIHDNTYIDNGQPKQFIYGNAADETFKPDAAGESTNPNRITFADWQKLGLDRGSRIIQGKNGRPAGEKVFLFANRYTKGRANIGIFNWDGKAQVEVSGAELAKALALGQRYVVYNCMDIHQTIALTKPVLTGTFTGEAVAFPMRKDKLSPDFDAFLILPVE